eukprot:3941531-Rhodomonas_salina.2
MRCAVLSDGMVLCSHHAESGTELWYGARRRAVLSDGMMLGYGGRATRPLRRYPRLELRRVLPYLPTAPYPTLLRLWYAYSVCCYAMQSVLSP